MPRPLSSICGLRDGIRRGNRLRTRQTLQSDPSATCGSARIRGEYPRSVDGREKGGEEGGAATGGHENVQNRSGGSFGETTEIKEQLWDEMYLCEVMSAI